MWADNAILYSNAPCKDCIKRHIGCHSKCDDYIYWKRDDCEMKTGILVSKLGGNEADSVIAARLKKIKKRLHPHGKR